MAGMDTLPTSAQSSRITSHRSHLAARKGCQPLPGVSRRKPLKAHGRGAKRVSRICVANSAPDSISTRQCVPSRIRCNFLKANDAYTSYSTVAQGVFRGTSYPDFARWG